MPAVNSVAADSQPEEPLTPPIDQLRSTAGCEVYAKQPRCSPMVVEEDLMAKDVNDNIQEVDQRGPSGNHQEKLDQWDFLGDSNNNNTGVVEAGKSDEPKDHHQQQLEPQQQQQRSVDSSSCAQKIGFVIEAEKITEIPVKLPENDHQEEDVVDLGRPAEEASSLMMDLEANSPPIAASSSAIDINCNNIVCVDEDDQGAVVVVVEMGQAAVTSSPSSICSAKDLIDFDSPQHHSSGVSDEGVESSQSSADQAMTMMFKLEEEEEEGRGNTNNNNNNKLNSISSISQMPDSPASVASMQSMCTDVDSGCEAYPTLDGSYSTPPPQPTKRFKSNHNNNNNNSSSRSLGSGDDDDLVSDLQAAAAVTPLKSERSLSSESLNSEASMESNDSKSSIRLMMSTRFSKNGTLERQSSNQNVLAERPPMVVAPTGLQVLVLWNNLLTKKCSQAISDMIKATTTLEVLNVGKNVLGNEFVAAIKASLCANDSISKLGLQSVHLSCAGAKTVAEIIESKCGSPLTRVDLRDNIIQVPGLTALSDAVRCNKSITQIDLNATPSGGSANSSPNDSPVVDGDVAVVSWVIQKRNLHGKGKM